MSAPLLTSVIAGRPVAAAPTSGRYAVTNPATEEPLATVAFASAEQAAEAMDGAVAVRDRWAAAPVRDRIALVESIANVLEEKRESLIATVVAEVGMPQAQAAVQQVGAAIAAVRDAVQDAPELLEPEVIGAARVESVAAGVVVAITPWNYPLYQAALKVAPALAAGCPVVLKPSEVTPQSVLALADAFATARARLAERGILIPAEVFSVVLGDGAIGEQLVSDARVDLVSLTGSTRAGIAVQRAVAAGVTRVSLELGGKSALLVLPGTDLAAAVDYGVARCLVNTGQTCAALTRLIVPNADLDAVERLVSAALARHRVGDPEAETTTLGPLVTRAQRDRVRSYIDAGVAAGARLIRADAGEAADTGDKGDSALPSRGWFVAPVAFSRTAPDMAIVQEEIFGPVLVIQSYEEVGEGIALANGTAYGLAAGVIGPSREMELAVAPRLRAGTVFVGAARPEPRAPFGGVKSSGFGRERGPHGLAEFLVTQSFVAAVEVGA